MSLSGTRPSGLATACSSCSPPQTVIRNHFQTLTGSCSTVHKPSRSVTGPLLPRSTPGQDRRPRRITNRVRKVADHPPRPGFGVRRQLQRAAPAFSPCRHILSSCAAEEVANSPRNQHRTRSSVRPRPRSRPRIGRERSPGAGVERKNLETLGIANATRTLK